MSDQHAESVARLFHDTYERLAPSYGYETRRESAVAWEDVPEQNRKLMVATCEYVLSHLPLNDGSESAPPGAHWKLMACHNCANPKLYRRRLCAACWIYERRHGRPRPAHLIHRHLERLDERRLAV